MKKNSILYLLIIVLFISNAIFVWLHFNKHHQHEGHNPGSFIAKKLDFNASQMAKFNVLNEAHETKMKTLFNDTKSLKDKLFENLGNKNDTAQELEELTFKLGKKTALRAQITFSHFNQILKICETEKQKEAFKTIIKKAMQRRKPKN